MELKSKDVQIHGLNIHMRPVLREADRIWKAHGQELVITCAMDGMHSAGSLHYYGQAVDLRSRYFTDSQKDSVVNQLNSTLGINYDVIVHSTHIHVEYQP